MVIYFSKNAFSSFVTIQRLFSCCYVDRKFWTILFEIVLLLYYSIIIVLLYLYKKEEINKRDPNSENLCQSSWKSNSCKTILTFLNAKHISKKWNEKLYVHSYSVTLKSFQERFQVPRRWQLADSTCGPPDTSNGKNGINLINRLNFYHFHISYLSITYFTICKSKIFKNKISNLLHVQYKKNNLWFKKITFSPQGTKLKYK